MDNPISPSSMIVAGNVIALPAFSSSGTTAEKADILPEKLGTCPNSDFNKVLLVDEDAETHFTFERLLKSAGYIVQHAIAEIDAIQLLRVCSPNFLIINWKQSIPSNVPFYESLRRVNQNQYLYIIVMVAGEPSSDKEEIARGADAFIAKPIKPEELLSCLRAGVFFLEQQMRVKQDV